METKTHFRKLANVDYLGAYSLYDNDGIVHDLDIAITSMSKKEVIGDQGKRDMCTVAQIQGQKPMILNSTNQKMLAKLMGSPFIENWYGRPFTIYVANIRVGGEPTECLRIRPTLPTPPPPQQAPPPIDLPDLNPQHEKWEAAKQALADGKTTLIDIRKKYTLSEANQALLIPEL